jgi:hypothetical protein
LLTPFTCLRSLLSSLPYDEDFGVILLRAGTQSLEAAAGRGWRNEVAGVYAGGEYFGEFSSEHGAGREREKEKEREREVLVNGSERMEYGSLRIGRADVGGMINASVTSSAAAAAASSSNSKQTPTKAKTKTKTLRGLRNEIRTVSSSFLPLASATELGDSADAESGSVQLNFMRAALQMLGIEVRVRALGRFVWAGVGVGWRVLRMFGKGGEVLGDEGGVEREGGRGREGGEEGVEGVGEEEGEGEGEALDDDDEAEEEDGEEAYRRFLRGESFSSSDEEDGEYGGDSDVDISQEDEDEGEEADESYTEDGPGPTAGQNEVLALLSDILFPSRGSDTGSASTSGFQDQPGASLRDVLAHLLHAPNSMASESDQDAYSTGPMTRRRWGARTGQYGDSSTEDYGDDEERWLEQRRRGRVEETRDGAGGEEKEKEKEKPTAGEARACVVCLAEVREVICWPCRCVSAFPLDFVHVAYFGAGAWQCVMGAGRRWLRGVCRVNIGVRVVDGG